LYSFFSSVAQFRSYQYNIENDPDERYFRSQSVKLINELLDEENAKGMVSDALMIAVAIMVNKEVTKRVKKIEDIFL
jgi:hypothetical protein